MTMLDSPTSDDVTPLSGVRGSLYESPTYGWTVVVDPERWIVAGSASGDGVDRLLLASTNPETPSARVTLHAAAGGVEDLASHIGRARGELVAANPGVTVQTATWESGPATPQELTEGHWIASYLIQDAPGEEPTIVDVDAWQIHGTNGIMTVVVSSRGHEYGPTRWEMDNLLFNYSPPRLARTGMSRVERALTGRGNDGVLEFRPLYLWRGYVGPLDEGASAFEANFQPPAIAVPDGKELVLASGVARNVDSLPSDLDLDALVGRFPEADNVPGNAEFRPVHHTWLEGGPPDAGRVTRMGPGDVAAWITWYVIDRVPGNLAGTQAIDISYEPGGIVLADCGPSSRIGYHGPVAGGGGGGGSRPVVQY